MKTRMTSRFVASKLFFAIAAPGALVGALLFRREVGSGLTAKDDLNPLFRVTRLIPFAASILSTFFVLVYYGFEKKSRRPASLLLVLVHLISYLFAILSQSTLMHFWWPALGKENANIPLPLRASVLVIVGFTVCFLAFGANIFWSMWRTPESTSNPR